MSHVAQVEIEVTNLDDLAQAARRLGLELVTDQKEYKAYFSAAQIAEWTANGRIKNLKDIVPPGFDPSEYGKCEHVIRLRPDKAREYEEKYHAKPYEIGIVHRRDGKPGFALLWDSIGCGLTDYCGAQLGRLKQAYALVAARRTAVAQGFRVVREVTAQDGRIQLEVTK